MSLDSVRKLRQQQHRLNKDEIEQLVAAYRGGASIKQLARQFAINRETAVKILGRADVEVRRPQLTQDQLEEALRLHRSGWSLIRLGQKYQMDPKTVKKRLGFDGPPA